MKPLKATAINRLAYKLNPIRKPDFNLFQITLHYELDYKLNSEEKKKQ